MKIFQPPIKSKSAITLLIFGLLAFALIGFSVSIFLIEKGVPSEQSSQPSSLPDGAPLSPSSERPPQELPVPEPDRSPTFATGTVSFLERDPTGALSVLELDPIEVSVEGVEGKDTVQLSWDGSQLDAFYIILFDEELFHAQSKEMVVWAISSLRKGSLPEDGIAKREDVTGFIPSGYTIGETILGFQDSPGASDRIQLTVGKKYLLQVNGFINEDEHTAVNREFTFTGSCLPPDCLFK